MNALRKIYKTHSDTVIIKIPEALRYQTLEIIVLPVSDELTETTAHWPANFFDKFVGCLPDFPEIESEGDYENREVLL